MFGLRSDPVLSWFLVMCKGLLFLQLSSSPAHSRGRSPARARPRRVRGTAARPRPPALRPLPASLPAGPCTHASRPGGVAGARWRGPGPHPSPPSREDPSGSPPRGPASRVAALAPWPPFCIHKALLVSRGSAGLPPPPPPPPLPAPLGPFRCFC